MQTLSTNNVAKKVQLRLDKFAFGQVSIQLMLAKQLQHNLQVLVALSLVFFFFFFWEGKIFITQVQ